MESLPRLFLRLLLLSAILFLAPSLRAENRQHFDVPAGDAIRTLAAFSEQSGREVLFAVDSVRGVRTNRVEGRFEPREALDRMLVGTALAVVTDQRSGALAITRREPEPPPKPPPRPSTATPSDPATLSVVRLETFEVSTTLGSYRETTTSAGTKVPMNIKDIPATIQVLNADFIADNRGQSLEDLYPYIVGMTRESTAATGFTLRGFSNNLTNTLLNNVQTDGLPGLASRFGSPTTANVERVEVVKGPASVLYGSMNPGGIINIVTKQPQVRGIRVASATVETYAGHDSPAWRDVSAIATIDVTGPVDSGRHWLYRFIASYEDLSGFRQFSWGRNTYLFPALTWRPSEDTDVTIKVDVTRQHRFSDQYLVAPYKDASLVAAHSVTYQDRNNTEYDRGDIYALSARHRLGNGWTLRANVRNVQHADGRDPLENRAVLDGIPVAESLVLQRWRDTWNRRRYSYCDLTLSGDVGAGPVRHSLLFGVDGGYETHDFIRWVFADLPGGVNVYHPRHDTRPVPYVTYDPRAGPSQDAVSKYYDVGAYASDQIRVGDHIHASVGAHFENYNTSYTDHAPATRSHFSNNPASFVPSAGIVVEPVEAVALYASYGGSFKPSQPQSVDTNGRGLPPELASQVEVGTKVDIDDGRIGVLLSAYRIQRRNVSEAVPLAYAPDNVAIYRFIGRQQSQGVELSVNYQPVPYWQTQIGYTYLDARTTTSLDPALVRSRIANAPRESANLWTRYNSPAILRGLGVGFGVIHVGLRDALLPSSADTRTMPLPGYTRLDVALYYKWRRYDFALNITNLLDHSYIASADSDVDVVPGDPRKISASLRYRF